MAHQPRGMAVHWVAGNVPVLGLLSLVQSLLCKNTNVLKVSHLRAGLLPHLLAGLADVTYTNPQGGTITGQAFCKARPWSMPTVRTRRRPANCCGWPMSAWRGADWRPWRQSSNSRGFGTEDIVFGPKLSFAIVGAERLGSEESRRATAKALAGDACVFQQQGCNSPHTVLVERGGSVTPACWPMVGRSHGGRVPPFAPPEVDPAATMNVLAVRTRIHLAAWPITAAAWIGRSCMPTTIAAWPNRATGEDVFVRPVDDVLKAVRFCSKGTQTVGLALTSEPPGAGRRLDGRRRRTLPEHRGDSPVRNALGRPVSHGPPRPLGQHVLMPPPSFSNRVNCL